MKMTQFPLFLISTFILNSNLFGIANANTRAPLVRAPSARGATPPALTGVRAHARQPAGSALNPAHQAQIQSATAKIDARLEAQRQARIKASGALQSGVRAHAQQPAGSALNPAHQAQIQSATAKIDARRAAIDQQHLQEVQAQAAAERAEQRDARLKKIGRSHF
jgi:hypothetical protein